MICTTYDGRSTRSISFTTALFLDPAAHVRGLRVDPLGQPERRSYGTPYVDTKLLNPTAVTERRGAPWLDGVIAWQVEEMHERE
jgi:hypothetical protein